MLGVVGVEKEFLVSYQTDIPPAAKYEIFITVNGTHLLPKLPLITVNADKFISFSTVR